MLSSAERFHIDCRIHRELARSFMLHGDWSDLTYQQMFDVIVDELYEVSVALDTGDYISEHGVYNELAQVAACCQKMMARVMNVEGL